MKSKIIVISGGSGAGKDSVIQKLIQKVPRLIEIPTYTTRPARPTEQGKNDHIFVSVKKFFQLVRSQEILEKNFYAGNWYGTGKTPLEKAGATGKIPILEIEPRGFRNLKKYFKTNLYGIFLFVPIKELALRLKKRGDLTEKQIQARLQIAERENQQSRFYQLVLENKRHQLDQTINQIIDFLEKNNIITP